jgi:N-acetylmuramoyl-L-alanine amidase
MEIAKRIKSQNFTSTAKPREIKYIILHFTEVPLDEALKLLTTNEGGVSCHYLIHKNGNIYGLVDEVNIAFHSGRSSWKNNHEMNDNSIGVEIDNSGRDEFGQDQMRSVIELCKELSEKYKIHRENILGHSDIAPARKLDPGIYFDWKLLTANNLGIGFQTPDLGNNAVLYNFGDNGKDINRLQEGLSRLGYRLHFTGVFDQQTNEVIRAFQSHFCPEVIHERGGIEYYNNPESIFVWDEVADRLLKSLVWGE